MAMSRYRTEQEEFWAGEFGTEYIERNRSQDLLANNISLFAQALRHAQPLASVLELGANIGMNMRALHLLFPHAELHAVEINATAYAELSSLPYVHAVNTSLLDYVPARTFDLVLTKGVMIHLDPAVLPEAYDKLFVTSHRYILMVEYYSLTPVEVEYRGHRNRLFKRDFAGELIDRHPSLHLVDYGFIYHRDPKWPPADVNWFLIEKG